MSTRTIVRHHTRVETVPRELRLDIKWFKKHPGACQRSRLPSKQERKKFGPDVFEILVIKLTHGGFATVPLFVDE